MARTRQQAAHVESGKCRLPNTNGCRLLNRRPEGRGRGILVISSLIYLDLRQLRATTGKFTSPIIMRPTSNHIAIPPASQIAGFLSQMGLEQRREKTRALKQAMMQELLTGRAWLV
jgi:hypothetical protein